MKIVLDANTLYMNWYLDGPDFTVIERHMALRGSELIVPEIIVLETISNHRKELSTLCGAVRKLGRLVREAGESLTPPDVDEASEAYRGALSLRLRALCAKRLTHTDVPHDAVVERALKVRKPFRESGRGYRDCLLWEVILRQVASSEEQTFLVSADKRDFGGKGTERGLHSDLRSDLSEAGLPEDCVKLYTSLRDFVQEVIVADLHAAMDDITEALGDGTYTGFSVARWLGDNCPELAAKCGASMERIIDFPTLESAELTNVDPPEPENISVDDVVRIDDGRVVLYATADADVTVDGYLFKADYYGLDENCPLEIMDPDWNDHYVWAQLNVTLPLRVALTLNVITNEVEDYEIDSIGEVFGWCRRCGALILSDAAEACSNCGRAFF